MPSFVVVKSGHGGTVDALLYSPNSLGLPDHRRSVPVNIKQISDCLLSVDGEPDTIVSCTGGNETATYLIRGIVKTVRDRARCAALENAASLLEQLTVSLKLAAGSTEPEPLAESLKQISGRSQ